MVGWAHIKYKLPNSANIRILEHLARVEVGVVARVEMGVEARAEISEDLMTQTPKCPHAHIFFC
jgi:hypothetical protein